MNVAINGFGRIGRLTLKIMLEDKDINVVAINNPSTPPDQLAYLLKFDSVHGSYNKSVESFEDHIIVDKKHKIYILRYKDPKDIPYSELNIEYMIDSTGLFTNKEKTLCYMNNKYIKKVVVTSPSEDIPTYVMGVNHEEYNNEKIVSNASCTTNCIGPILKLLNNTFDIKEAKILTIHSSTASQSVVDKSNGKNWRLGRSTLNNIIPTSTGASDALVKIMPYLKGKIIASSIRVPTVDGSIVFLDIIFNKKTNLEEINELIKTHSKSPENMNIIEFSNDHLVSSDIIGKTFSTIYDSLGSTQLNKKSFQLACWYDNETGYSNRVVNLLKHISLLSDNKNKI